MQGNKVRLRSAARALGAGAALFLVWAGVAPAAGLPTEARVDALVRYFDVIVFGAEIEKKLAQKVVAKWDGPIRIAFQGRVRPEYRRFAAAHLKTLAALTGVTFQVLKPGQKGQSLDLVFVPRAQMGKIKIPGVDPKLIAKLAAPGGCYFLSWKKPEKRIIKAVIVVNSERDKFGINHCLLEEISQSLGLPNDSDLIRPSLFSDRDQLTEPSRTDKILLKALYHPRMKAGLARREALRTATKIIAELDYVLP
jgi:hypothetical protein